MLHGAGYLLRGFSLWRTRPGLMLLGMVPALVVLLVVGAALVALLLNVGGIVGWATPFADDWSTGLRGLLRIGLAILLVVGSFYLASVTFTGLTLAVGDPFYERIWLETERMLGGEVPEEGVGFGRALVDAVVLTLLGLLASIVVFLLGFLPVVGTIVGAVLGVVVAGGLLAGELVSRPLEARGLDRAARSALTRPRRPALLGFGVATQVFFLVPLGAVVVMPAAVVGSTMLARELLEG